MNLEEWWQWRAELREANCAIVVEGKRDRAALEQLGMSNIVVLSRRPLHQIAEEIAATHRKVVILTDFDKKGKELYGKLAKHFSRLGVKVDRYFREFLQQKTKLSHVEGILTYLTDVGTL